MGLLGAGALGHTSDPSIAIVFSITTSGSGVVPTIIKGRRSPEAESIAAYLGGIVSGLSAFAAVTAWSLPSVAFPSYMLLNKRHSRGIGLTQEAKAGRRRYWRTFNTENHRPIANPLFVRIIGTVPNRLISVDVDPEISARSMKNSGVVFR